MKLYMCVYMYTYTYMYTHIFLYIYIYIYIYIDETKRHRKAGHWPSISASSSFAIHKFNQMGNKVFLNSRMFQKAELEFAAKTIIYIHIVFTTIYIEFIVH